MPYADSEYEDLKAYGYAKVTFLALEWGNIVTDDTAVVEADAAEISMT